MKVRELIEKLKEMDPEMKVAMDSGEGILWGRFIYEMRGAKEMRAGMALNSNLLVGEEYWGLEGVAMIEESIERIAFIY